MNKRLGKAVFYAARACIVTLLTGVADGVVFSAFLAAMRTPLMGDWRSWEIGAAGVYGGVVFLGVAVVLQTQVIASTLRSEQL